MAKEIDTLINPDYGTRTDFIRAAVRDKIKQERKDRLLKVLEENFGKAKPKNNKTDRQIREEVSEMLKKEWGLD